MRTKTSEKAETILQAAAELFASQRFHEVRMDDIALAADVGKGTLYRYFADKEKLYQALLEHSAKQFIDKIRAAIAREQAPRKSLEAAVVAILVFFKEQPNLFDLIQRAEVLQGPDFPWGPTRQQLIEAVTELFESMNQQADAEFLALLLLGGVRSIIRFGKGKPQDLARQIVDVFVPQAGR